LLGKQMRECLPRISVRSRLQWSRLCSGLPRREVSMLRQRSTHLRNCAHCHASSLAKHHTTLHGQSRALGRATYVPNAHTCEFFSAFVCSSGAVSTARERIALRIATGTTVARSAPVATALPGARAGAAEKSARVTIVRATARVKSAEQTARVET
jgi:hypothetical protein